MPKKWTKDPKVKRLEQIIALSEKLDNVDTVERLPRELLEAGIRTIESLRSEVSFLGNAFLAGFSAEIALCSAVYEFDLTAKLAGHPKIGAEGFLILIASANVFGWLCRLELKRSFFGTIVSSNECRKRKVQSEQFYYAQSLKALSKEISNCEEVIYTQTRLLAVTIIILVSVLIAKILHLLFRGSHRAALSIHASISLRFHRTALGPIFHFLGNFPCFSSR